ncbi:outer membrane protein assembly factor BamD [Sulfuriroseicoccus oceanibius]|uniref:Outer membrane protein assembly factor BamD n=1 Tax=Sulfuriroseicoccus oceanibius TaxID=2707525 RepID=A0A6B3LD85_9BACT|nr:outer membrane protein assembly factor BamD [Sulfuriroseicoccus oceanibius]QQL44498.1 outer membrane protein assembly factor BamD [Sulfuriroseicoccus oceanibius]
MNLRNRLSSSAAVAITASVLASATLTTPADAGIFSKLFGGGDKEELPTQTELEKREQAAAELVAKAQEQEQKGDFKDAAKIYRKLVKKFPLTKFTADAAIRSAELFESEGEPTDAFDVYQKFIELSRDDKRYGEVLKAQYELAQRSKTGDFKRRVVGLPLDVPMNKKVEMFETVSTNSPRSPLAAQSLFAIGEVYQEAGKTQDAIMAYGRVVSAHGTRPQAPIAQFRIGQLHMATAAQGAKDTSTITSAREAFEDFLLAYPDHKLAPKAKELLKTVDKRQAAELLKVAKFYEKTEKYRAAALYYRDVIKRGGDEAVVEEAKARLAALQAKGGELNAPTTTDPEDSDGSLTKDRKDYVGPKSED